MQAVSPEAMEVPAIATYVNSQLMTNTATLLNGERFGSWVKTSLMAQLLGVPAP